MSRGDRCKDDSLEDTRIDSGIDSYRPTLQSEDHREPSGDLGGARDKYAVEERVDSAYGSSSITADSLSEIVQACSLSRDAEEQSHELCEENPLTSITEDGDTILHLAIIHEETHIAQELIQLFPKEVLDIQNNLYQSPLHLATYLNLTDVVRELTRKGASLELQDQDGNTALHVACQHGQKECASAMTRDFSYGSLEPVLKIQNWRGLACLHLAALNRKYQLLKLLVKKGADLNVQEGTSGTASRLPRCSRRVEHLLRPPTDKLNKEIDLNPFPLFYCPVIFQNSAIRLRESFRRRLSPRFYSFVSHVEPEAATPALSRDSC